MTLERKITVIVPIYNVEQYLHRCVESILNQTYSNLQIVLIDDGSTDHSLSVCRELEERDHRIEVYHTRNKGSVAARKYGLNIAKGDYIGFVDGDDYIESEMLFRLLDVLTTSGADFVHSGYVEEAAGEEHAVCDFDEMTVDIRETCDKIKFLRKYVLGGEERSPVTPSLVTKLFKRDFIKSCFQYLPNNQQYGEDLICLWRCVLEGRRMALHKGTMYHYVKRNHSLSDFMDAAYMQKEIHLWHYLLEVIEKYKYLEALKKEMDIFFKRRMVQVMKADGSEKMEIPRYYYKNLSEILGKKVVIFGAGDVGRDYYAQIRKYEDCEIVGWVDSNYKKYHFEYVKVTDKWQVCLLPCDKILVAVKKEKTRLEIKEWLLGVSVAEDKIDWSEPGIYY